MFVEFRNTVVVTVVAVTIGMTKTMIPCSGKNIRKCLHDSMVVRRGAIGLFCGRCREN